MWGSSQDVRTSVKKRLGVNVEANPGLCLSAWQLELADDPDKDFLLHGIENGFDIVDTNEVPTSVECDNHTSARSGSPVHDLMEDTILQEISQGNYVVTDNKPSIISALGAVLKAGGDIRLIHDCSRPHGGSVNDYATLPADIKFQSVDSAANLIKPGYYMCKFDLLHAYLQVKISNASQDVTGIKWAFDGSDTYMYDTKLMFGSKLAPSIFHRLTQARHQGSGLFHRRFMVVCPHYERVCSDHGGFNGIVTQVGVCN
jgi:hypothetical protein